MDGDQPRNNDGTWTDCGDGLHYLYGQELPTIASLARGHRVDGCDYTTASGVLITVPIATAAPRKVLFASGKTGEPATDFALRAFELFDRLQAMESGGETVLLSDPKIIKLIADALAHVYYVTPELLDELGWITTADIDPLICALMGIDQKKAETLAGDTSPLPAGA